MACPLPHRPRCGARRPATSGIVEAGNRWGVAHAWMTADQPQGALVGVGAPPPAGMACRSPHRPRCGARRPEPAVSLRPETGGTSLPPAMTADEPRGALVGVGARPPAGMACPSPYRPGCGARRPSGIVDAGDGWGVAYAWMTADQPLGALVGVGARPPTGIACPSPHRPRCGARQPATCGIVEAGTMGRRLRLR
jgi:hypothetical protein